MLKNKFEDLKKKENLRENLSWLRSEVKEESANQELKQLAENDNILQELLLNEDAKVRKSAALLLGELRLQAALEDLFDAYCKEETLFVKSAYLTAMSKLNAEAHLEFFKQRYKELTSQSVTVEEKKHVHEETKALLDVILSIEGLKKHTFTGFKNPHELLLATNREQREVTLNEVKELSATVQRSTELHPMGVKVYAKDVVPFTKLRTYRELLFPLSAEGKVDGTPADVAKQLWESGIYDFLKECHKEEGPFFFRVELKSSEPQIEFVKKLGAAIEEISGWQMVNAPKGYEVEIRLVSMREGGYLPLLKLFTLSMKRFSYRKNAVAMSLHPATAAMLVRLAKPYLKEDVQILDPCCGVGTMLIERDICVPAREKYGIDIFGEAIEMARENASLAGERINFIHRDYFDFKHDYKFDEIITNMPVKGKKTREEMDAFYAEFFKKSKEVLASDGIIIMYTNEIGFVKKQLRLQTNYRLLQEFEIRKKDDFHLFIIGIKG